MLSLGLPFDEAYESSDVLRMAYIAKCYHALG